MQSYRFEPSRRRFLKKVGGLSILAALGSRNVSALAPSPVKRRIPSSGEQLPVIGMGSWRTFDITDDIMARAVRTQVLQTFFDMGGAMIDSSPMYGSSEEIIGYCLGRIQNRDNLFSATKIWIIGKQTGIRQMQNSEGYWGVSGFDLMQIHNMVDWETHLETLRTWKAEGRIRYIGITTSHGRRHNALQQALERESFDFVQFTYNIVDREVEQYLLPLAAERGMATIINRPFQRGNLFRYVAGKPLPGWASDFDCYNWAQFFLKFIISHPQVTCAIPATSRVEHMQENMGAAFGRLPDFGTRQRMFEYFSALT
jgi:diketogulonate reductase-like aldo/keto reductase